VIDSYEKAILLHRRLKKEGKTKDFNEIVGHLEIEIFLDGYHKVFSMGSGRGFVCK
jgi:hypothetical protein